MPVPDPPERAEHPDDHRQFLRNEFAMVEVTLIGERHAQRLRIRNAETDDVVELDPLELEALTRLSHGELGRLIVADGAGEVLAG